MRKIAKFIFEFLKEGFNFLFFLINFIFQGSFKNYFKNKQKGVVAVLANGPSLKEELPKLNNDPEFNNVDFIVLNFFAFEETFFQIKPKHYCFADPMFFQDSMKKDDVKRIFDILENKVNWAMAIYVPNLLFKKFVQYSKITNDNIKIIKMNTNSYFGYERFRNYFYKKNMAMPAPQTVANLAIFIGLNSGYNELRLYGVDHTFFDSLSVNENNELCNKELHFYNDHSTMKPLYNISTRKVYRVSDYLFAISNMFRSHDLLSKYAIFLGVKILNYTKNSMIDSYDRRK